MERRVKERLIGAAILVAFVVLLVPEFLSGPRHANVAPVAPDPQSMTRTYWVDAAHVDSAPPAAQSPSTFVASAEPVPAAPAAAPPQPAARAPFPVPTPAVSKPAAGAWTVQLGSFASKANAESFVRQLKAEGFNVYIASVGSAAAQRYRVRLGPIADRGTASAIMAKLQAQRHSSTLLPPGE